MSFSLFLGGLGLLTVPIVLHLLMRRRPRRLIFPALRLVQQQGEANRRSLRLRHLLLLLLRAAAIVLLGLALSRPTVKFSGPIGSQEAPVAAAVIVDTSVRMEYVFENRTRLDVAQEWAKWLLKQLPATSRAMVLDGRIGTPAFQTDLLAAAERIDRLRASASARELPEVVSAAADFLAASDIPRREIYVLTDLSRAAWPEEATARMARALQGLGDYSIYLIDVGVKSPNDTGIARVQLQQDVVTAGAPLGIEAELAHAGAAATRNLEVYVERQDTQHRRTDTLSEASSEEVTDKARYVASDSLPRVARPVTLQPGRQRELVRFQLPGFEPGLYQGAVLLTGTDNLAEDDIQPITFRVVPAQPVLVVAPSPTQEHARFAASALAPPELQAAGEAPFDAEVRTYAELVDTDLDAYDAVLLLDPAALDDAVWRKLTGYVADGHGLGVFLGPRASDLAAWNGTAAQALLAGPLLRQARALDGSIYLTMPATGHPIVAPLASLDVTIPWAVSPVFRYWQLGDLTDGTQVVMSYTDGRPAILARPIGRGAVVTMTTPISMRAGDNAWNLLPTSDASWPFVILLDGMAQYLASGGSAPLNFVAGESAVIPVRQSELLSAYTLSRPDGVEVRLVPDQVERRITVAATDDVGNYLIQGGGFGNPVDLGFSVQLPAAQTELARIEPDRLDDAFGEVPLRLATTRDQLEVGIAKGRVGRELFPALIVLVVLVLGCEQIVSNRFYRE